MFKEIKKRKWLLVFFSFIVVAAISCGGANGGGDGSDDDVSQLGTKKLLIFYSWPNAINDAGLASDAVAAAAAEYGKYNYVVLNRTFSGSDCPQDTVSAIINHPSCKNTIFFGYIDLGMLASSHRLEMSEIKTRIAAWNDMGVDGIFFDEYGFDYDVTRARQNEAIDAVHAVKSKKRGKMLSVIANAWILDDVFSADVNSVSNPDGSESHMGSNDYFLLESFFISEGNYVDAASPVSLQSAIKKMNDATKYCASNGSMALTITTNSDTALYDEDKFLYSWYAALILGAEGSAWGEYVFSAGGSALNSSPFRSRPSQNFGSGYAGKITVNGNLIQRKTDTGTLYINTSTHAYGFIAD
ncbi:MAG TPA: hypothetical protein PK419_09655 [Spirochaetota bacterium]|nr:hypothetical protein [Spirochaetota bacterium]HQA53108.1 hypothetical protein [Spirochaetota bacterium]